MRTVVEYRDGDHVWSLERDGDDVMLCVADDGELPHCRMEYLPPEFVDMVRKALPSV